MDTQFTSGRSVRVGYHGQSIDATVSLASPNGRSLMLSFAGALRTPSGGMMVGNMPLLQDDDGIFRDLVEGAPATLTSV